MDPQTAILLERAAELRRAGRVEEAIAGYTAVLERDPDLPDSWYNLGYLQRQARQYEAALRSYDEALKRSVSEPEEVHLNRAVILSDHLARPEEAERELLTALEINPNYLPALLNLGNLHEDRGERKAARQAYERVLKEAPGHSLALSRLAGVVDPQAIEAPGLIDRLRSALGVARDALEEADLGFALGRLLDARGDYGGAFEAYRRANEASRKSFGPAFLGYDRAGHERFVDRLITAFPAPATPDHAEEPPVFICGMFRSGSTLAERILAGHKTIAAGGELDLLPTLANRIAGYPEAVASAAREMLGSWRQFYLEGIAPIARPGSIVTDKRPDNFLHIGLIKTLFPAAKIVHTRRNRLDNLLSLYFLHLDPRMAYALDLADAAHWHGQHDRLMDHWKRLYPKDIFELDYDALVRDPEPSVKDLVAFLGLDWDKSLLDFHSRKGAVKTASVWQVREPLHRLSSGRWKNYERQLKAALGDGAVD